jgi:hypothetical protein
MRQPTRDELRLALATLKRLEATAPFIMPSETPRSFFLDEKFALADTLDLLAELTGEHSSIGGKWHCDPTCANDDCTDSAHTRERLPAPKPITVAPEVPCDPET